MIHRYCDLHAECMKTKDVIKLIKYKTKIMGKTKNENCISETEKCNRKMLVVAVSRVPHCNGDIFFTKNAMLLLNTYTYTVLFHVDSIAV